MSPKSSSRVIYWFRTDLRLHDSPALTHALSLNPSHFYPIFTFDPHYVFQTRGSSNRWQYLLDCMSDLSASITKLNKKSQLFVLRGAPQDILPIIAKEWSIDTICFESDESDPYARDRDHTVTQALTPLGIRIESRAGRTLWPVADVQALLHGKPPTSMAAIKSLQAKLGRPAKPLPAPTALPDPGPTGFPSLAKRGGAATHPAPPALSPDLSAAARTHPPAKVYSSLSGADGAFSVPTLSEELGLRAATTPHRGGEMRALATLDALCRERRGWVARFSKPDTAPTATDTASGEAGTTLLSAQVHFGSLSVRQFYWAVESAVEEYKRKGGKGVSAVPTNLHGQLMFRDMYFHAQAAVGEAFGRVRGNALVRFIPWALMTEYDKKGEPTGEYTNGSPETEEWLLRWREGKTGFPWIDALMRQLRQEGWIHHLGRHAVACFLTRGGCYIDWERGAEVFAEWLLDHEPACNAGNWQWLSCTAFFSQYYRMYSPVAFPQKWDKDGEFVRQWVPELAKYDKKYIYEPWKAPIADQKARGCVIRKDWKLEDEGEFKCYPKPMFDFAERRQICLDAMKKAYSVGLHGDDDAVKDGSWETMFE